MKTLDIRLLGTMRLRRGTELILPTRPSRALLSYLILNRHRPHPRETLLATFWGDRVESSARGCLRTNLWRIRSIIEEGLPRGTYLDVGHDAVRFNTDSAYKLDVEEFERGVRAVAGRPVEDLTETDAEKAVAALGLYRGNLLENVYDEWCLAEQERLKSLHRTALLAMMRYHENREHWERALRYGQRLLAADPLHERVHRDLMRIHAEMGNLPAALRQYVRCAAALRRHLDVEPMPVTVDLFNRMKQSRGAAPLPTAGVEGELTRELEGAQRDLDAARRQIERSLQKIHGGLRPPSVPD